MPNYSGAGETLRRRTRSRAALLHVAHDQIGGLFQSQAGDRMSAVMRRKLEDLDSAILRGVLSVDDDVASRRTEKEIEILRCRVLADLPDDDKDASAGIRAIMTIFD